MEKVNVGGKDVGLTLPKSFALRNEIAVAGITNWQRAVVAALGVCWTGPGKPKAKYESTYSPMEYGGEVIDELVERGLDPADLWEPAAKAYYLVTSSLLAESEVADKEVFTGAQKEASTG